MVSKPTDSLELQSVLVEELRLGVPLPGALRDFYGRILIPARTRLSQAILDQVADATGTRFRVYVGPDWAGYEPLTHEQRMTVHERVIQSLKVDKQIHDWAEKRQSPRYNWARELTLAIEETKQLSVTRRQVRIRTVDISVTGLGFVYEQFLNPGTVIYAQFDMVPGAPILQGMVRYCHLIRGMTHRVGVQFTACSSAAKSSGRGV